jgi:hypothetical protein
MASVHAVTHLKFGKRAAIKIAHKSILGDTFSSKTFARHASSMRSIIPASSTCSPRARATAVPTS